MHAGSKLLVTMAANQRQLAMDKVEVLRRTDLFRALNEDLLKKIATHGVARQLERGQILFSEHEEASAVYVVASGELRSIRQSAEGREQVLSTERAGAILALAPVFNSGKFYSTVIADSDAQVLCIDRDEMRELCQEHMELFWHAARVLAHKVRHLASLVESLALRNVEQRVAQFIVTIAHERGLPAGDGSIVELKLTRSQMAARLGSAREVVSRAMTHLDESGLIQMQGRRLVTIPNMRALSAFAGVEREADKTEIASEVASDVA